MLWGGYHFKYGFSEKVAFGQRFRENLDFERTSRSSIRGGGSKGLAEKTACAKALRCLVLGRSKKIKACGAEQERRTTVASERKERALQSPHHGSSTVLLWAMRTTEGF